MSHIIGNRNSTPEASSSTLRPPSQRASMGPGHHLRASADMGGVFSAAAPLSNRNIRPSSEVYYNPLQQGHSYGAQDESLDKAAQQWIADIDQYENTLEEMAAATLDQDFKDELSAIEQWFCVLSEAERTAALYALLRQTTQVQIKFFIGVLQQMSKTHPVSSVLSPPNFAEKDPTLNRLSSAMNKMNPDGSRSSFGPSRAAPSFGGGKRLSGLDQDEINSMFPDAAAAIARRKAEFTQHTGAAAPSNRNSMLMGDRASMMPPTISAPHDDLQKDSFAQPLPSPWGSRPSENQSNLRPKSSSGQQPMGQFSQPPLSAGLRSARPMTMSHDIHSTTLNAPENSLGMNLLSPYAPGASWASMSNTPMNPSFPQQQTVSHADMVANATALKLAALSTVNNRIQLDDVRKYRRTRSSDDREHDMQTASSIDATAFPTNFIMTNENGQILTPQQIAVLQAQQIASLNGHRSRPTSPAIGIQGAGIGGLNVPQQGNGYLSAYDGGFSNVTGGMSGLNLSQYGNSFANNEGYLSDTSEINRGRSPRGKRGSSRPPEDPTDLELLNDIPAWLRSLRLHKYTDNLKNMRWQDMVMLDEDGLDRHGVNALGARRKLIKVFEQVREAQALGKI